MNLRITKEEVTYVHGEPQIDFLVASDEAMTGVHLVPEAGDSLDDSRFRECARIAALEYGRRQITKFMEISRVQQTTRMRD